MTPTAEKERTTGLLKIIADGKLRLINAKKTNGHWTYYENKKVIIPDSKYGPRVFAAGLKKHYHEHGYTKVDIEIH